MNAFGMNGYGREATEAILEAVRGYDRRSNYEDDLIVISAASQAISRIGVDAGPPLVEELRKGNPNGRRFAISELGDLSKVDRSYDAEILRACSDKDSYVRQVAL